MQLRPRFHQSALASRESTGDHINGVDSDDRYVILPVRMKVRDVMRCARLGEHANDNSEKATELRYPLILCTG